MDLQVASLLDMIIQTRCRHRPPLMIDIVAIPALMIHMVHHLVAMIRTDRVKTIARLGLEVLVLQNLARILQWTVQWGAFAGILVCRPITVDPLRSMGTTSNVAAQSAKGQ